MTDQVNGPECLECRIEAMEPEARQAFVNDLTNHPPMNSVAICQRHADAAKALFDKFEPFLLDEDSVLGFFGTQNRGGRA